MGQLVSDWKISLDDTINVKNIRSLVATCCLRMCCVFELITVVLEINVITLKMLYTVENARINGKWKRAYDHFPNHIQNVPAIYKASWPKIETQFFKILYNNPM